MAKRGRPTKYNEKYHIKWGYALARLGYTDEQIAKEMGISEATLNTWKLKYEAFSGALKKGKEQIVNQIENALYKRALGYRYKEKHEEIDKDGNVIKKRMIIKEVAPDPTSCIFSLKNLAPDKWRDKKEIEMSEKTEHQKKLEAMTDEELYEAYLKNKKLLEE